MKEVEKVSDIAELPDILWHIGMIKKDLPLRLRGWVNELGLYVQLSDIMGYTVGWEVLKAGGKFRSYFKAQRRYHGGEIDPWEVKQFDEETWNRRFAHLVKPTDEVTSFLLRRTGRGLDERDVAILEQVVAHLKTTGEWLGFPKEVWCLACDQLIAIGEWEGESCPYCGSKLNSKA